MEELIDDYDFNVSEIFPNGENGEDSLELETNAHSSAEEESTSPVIIATLTNTSFKDILSRYFIEVKEKEKDTQVEANKNKSWENILNNFMKFEE